MTKGCSFDIKLIFLRSKSWIAIFSMWVDATVTMDDFVDLLRSAIQGFFGSLRS